jgi:hypothetical protein
MASCFAPIPPGRSHTLCAYYSTINSAGVVETPIACYFESFTLCGSEIDESRTGYLKISKLIENLEKNNLRQIKSSRRLELTKFKKT